MRENLNACMALFHGRHTATVCLFSAGLPRSIANLLYSNHVKRKNILTNAVSKMFFFVEDRTLIVLISYEMCLN